MGCIRPTFLLFQLFTIYIHHIYEKIIAVHHAQRCRCAMFKGKSMLRSKGLDEKSFIDHRDDAPSPITPIHESRTKLRMRGLFHNNSVKEKTHY